MIVRPFLPAKDFQLSQRFYETLGFEKQFHNGDIAVFATGSGGFLLQNHYQKDWAENFMLQLLVDDLDAWWTHVQSLDLPGGAKLRAPEMQPWGLREAALIDPSGVCWHVLQR
jgi:uncharacterized glyoxalase superfamily protein PhnB